VPEGAAAPEAPVSTDTVPAAPLQNGGVIQSVLTATENGYGKRTPITEYTRHGRGTKGMIAISTSERNGKVVAATLVDTKDEIMLITTGGVLIRTRVSEIREMGRATQGVTLINVDEGTKLSGLQRVVESDADVENSNGNGNGHGEGDAPNGDAVPDGEVPPTE
jgi:DNA gyrase subunit A